jgi:hypothetical protein
MATGIIKLSFAGEHEIYNFTLIYLTCLENRQPYAETVLDIHRMSYFGLQLLS